MLFRPEINTIYFCGNVTLQADSKMFILRNESFHSLSPDYISDYFTDYWYVLYSDMRNILCLLVF